eukprot:CAMPEP_0169137050 /NCGR_PEP_ID=MMETSP1015-20121227/41293_1 /TAXON_ID=342587 /ORGANISM="Karlodinium micrum, Strain CCMP2283" /LENGTH=158 /DNA_ID=CAMNT_0009201791 /DNA_START=89 /DNA_END=565 /DNA_ORIENTATION=-
MMADDFYVEPDDTTRGVVLYVPPLSYHNDDEADTYCKDMERQDYPLTFFGEGEAPLVPEDPFFHLELTTMRFPEKSAAQIANSVIHFLNENTTSRITKTSSRKFTIKADIVFDDALCGVKARVYRQASGQHCVEMQRRSGDTIAFNRFYKSLSQHMQS